MPPLPPPHALLLKNLPLPPLVEQQGELVVFRNEALLPEVCVKCGATTEISRKRQSFAWFPQWIYALLIVNVLIMAIVALAMQKKGALNLPLCRRCRARWRNAQLAVGGSIIWLFAGLILGAVVAGNSSPALGILLIVSAVAAPIAAAVGLARPATLQAKHVDDWRITLRGIHPDAVPKLLAAAAEDRSRRDAEGLPTLGR